MDSAAASRGESPLPSVSFPSPVSSPRPRSAAPFLFSPVRVREHERGGGFSAMRPRCGRSCHCSGDRYPGSRLRVKVTTLYLESQLMPPPLSRDHPLIIDEPPSATVLTQLLRNLSPTPAVRRPCSPSLSLSLPLSLSFEEEEEEEARTSGKPKSAIPITGMIYRLRAVLVSYLPIGQCCHHRFPSLRSDRKRTIAPSSRRSAGDFSGKILPLPPPIRSAIRSTRGAVFAYRI